MAVGAASGRAGRAALGRRPPRRKRRISQKEHGRVARLKQRAQCKCPGMHRSRGICVAARRTARRASGTVTLVDNIIDKYLDNMKWNLYAMVRVRLRCGAGTDRAPAARAG